MAIKKEGFDLAEKRCSKLGLSEEYYKEVAEERIQFFMEWANRNALHYPATSNVCERLSEHLMECFEEFADKC